MLLRLSPHSNDERSQSAATGEICCGNRRLRRVDQRHHTKRRDWRPSRNWRGEVVPPAVEAGWVSDEERGQTTPLGSLDIFIFCSTTPLFFQIISVWQQRFFFVYKKNLFFFLNLSKISIDDGSPSSPSIHLIFSFDNLFYFILFQVEC